MEIGILLGLLVFLGFTYAFGQRLSLDPLIPIFVGAVILALYVLTVTVRTLEGG